MSTRRQEYRAALHAILEAWRATYPRIRQTYRARPATFYPPCAYVGPFSEPTITLEFGNRLGRPDQRSSLVIVEGVYEAGQTADNLDEAGDSLLTFLITEHSRVSGSTLLQPLGGPEEVDLSIDGTVWAAAVIPVGLNSLE